METTNNKKKSLRDLVSTRKDIYTVKLKDISIEDGFNVREDLGDIPALMNQIKEAGRIIQPMTLRYAEGKLFIVNGHRRFEALTRLKKDGVKVEDPICLIENRGYTEQDRTLDLVLTNDSKPLTPIEESAVYNRLVQSGMAVSEISKRVGQSAVWINKLLKLHNASDEVKELIAKDEISASAAMDVLQTVKDPEKAVAKIKELVSTNTEKHKSAKPGKKKKAVSIKDAKGKSSTAEVIKRIKEAQMEYAISGHKAEFSSHYITELCNHFLFGKPEDLTKIKN